MFATSAMVSSLLTIGPSGGTDRQAIDLVFRSADTMLAATVAVPPSLTPEDAEAIRWYIEEYRAFPFEPATTIADSIALRIRQIGEELFEQIFFVSAEARAVWDAVEQAIEFTRVEFALDPTRFPGRPWELLWNPLDVAPLACRVGAFVRSGAERRPLLSEVARRKIRILLIISRPAGVLDAPFRSVAARLLDRIGLDARFEVDVLRPSTFDALVSSMQNAAQEGRPFDVVHFDGHGIHDDLDARRAKRPARRQRGFLVFETTGYPDRPEYINAPTLAEAFATGGWPILILNACRSARTGSVTEVSGKGQPFGSLADELIQLGLPAVVAMQYNVQVRTASSFVDDLYLGLAQHGSLAKAVQVGRYRLFLEASGRGPHQRLVLQDWLVPVLFEASPCTLVWKSENPAERTGLPVEFAQHIFGADDGLMALDRAFQNSRVVVLCGPIGSGKSTLAREFLAWDERTRSHRDRANSPLHLLTLSEAGDGTSLPAGCHALIETRDINVELSVKNVVVQMTPLDLPARIAIFSQRMGAQGSFNPELLQSLLAFSQGNPAVLEEIADLALSLSPPERHAVLELARARAIGLNGLGAEEAFQSFTSGEMDCIAVAALLEGPVSTHSLRALTFSSSTTDVSDIDDIFCRLSRFGLTTPLGNGYYRMHPGLPGLLRTQFEGRYRGERGEDLKSAIITLFALQCTTFERAADSGQRDAYEIGYQAVSRIEPSIWRVLDQAIASQRWQFARHMAAALRRILTQQGRRPDWQRLAARLVAYSDDPVSGAPMQGRGSLWHLMQEDRIEHLIRTHALGEAAWLQERLLQRMRDDLDNPSGSEAGSLASDALISQLRRMAEIRKDQGRSDAVVSYLEALGIAQRLGSVIQEQRIAVELAAFHLVQDPIDLIEVSYWETYAGEVCADYDRIGRAGLKILQGDVALACARPGEAIECFQTALDKLLPADASDERADCERKLGTALVDYRGDISNAMLHIQAALAWYDRDQNVFRASNVRLAASNLLSKLGESGRALFYAEHAAVGFASLAPHAERQAHDADRLAVKIKLLEKNRKDAHDKVVLG